MSILLSVDDEERYLKLIILKLTIEGSLIYTEKGLDFLHQIFANISIIITDTEIASFSNLWICVFILGKKEKGNVKLELAKA